MTFNECVLDHTRFELKVTAMSVKIAKNTAECNFDLVERTQMIFEEEHQDLTFMANCLKELEIKIHELKKKRDRDKSPINSKALWQKVSEARISLEEAQASYNVNLQFIHTHSLRNNLLCRITHLLADATSYERYAFYEKEILPTKLLAIREVADLIKQMPQLPELTNLNIQKLFVNIAPITEETRNSILIESIDRSNIENHIEKIINWTHESKIMHEQVEQEIWKGEKECNNQKSFEDVLNKLVPILKQRDDTVEVPNHLEGRMQFIINLAKNLVSGKQVYFDNDLVLGLEGHSYKAVTSNVCQSKYSETFVSSEEEPSSPSTVSYHSNWPESIRHETFLSSVAPASPVPITRHSKAYFSPVTIIAPFIYAIMILRIGLF